MSRARPNELKTVIYGPVPSWRLGRSLGIDVLARSKTCSLDCIYCQLGPTRHLRTDRAKFVPIERVTAELDALPELETDVITFSGLGRSESLRSEADSFSDEVK
jgi:wyosine [tRNA(Phe)-imidazoG37] synthetase (radical SAM superfamily)